MELVERECYFSILHQQLSKVDEGEGHCVFVCGESGIGKTSLLKSFTREIKKDYKVYEGSCDALFTPRPLAPLYDIAWQISDDLIDVSTDMHNRGKLFSKFFQEIKKQEQTSIIVFEDIHWADEATIDFIKFMARRISQLPCMFILSYRDNEIHNGHPMSNMFGQMSPDSFTRMEINPLSEEAVIKMAVEKGYDGWEVYKVSGGNPFYVNEILASYSEGVPVNIRDGIISAYDRTAEKSRQVWDLLSVIPGQFEIRYLEKFDPSYLEAINNCMQFQILIQQNGQIFFKHELFRRTIENSLSPLKRVALNKSILDLFISNFESNNEIERIVHHAKNANEYELVVKYAPAAAKHAAALGAHIEASKLLLTAIEYYQGDEVGLRISLYEGYAYECYLINSIKQAIIYTGKTLKLLKENGNIEKIVSCTRFLSHLLWRDGDRKTAMQLAQDAVQIIMHQPSSEVKAMAYSNISQLKMLCDETNESLDWGKKAIMIAEEINDEEALCHAMNNVGTILMNMPDSREEGLIHLRDSLAIALKNSYHEHAARAYANIAGNGMKLKDYSFARESLEDGISYCEQRELDFWKCTLLSIKAKLMLETGNWSEAYSIANQLLENDFEASFRMHAMIVVGLIRMRRGDLGEPDLLIQAKQLAFASMELQVMIPSIVALLEYEWLSGRLLIGDNDLNCIISKIDSSIYYMKNRELAFWLRKVHNRELKLKVKYDASCWRKSDNLYMSAMALFEGNEEDKRNAISIMLNLGGESAYEKMKMEMRASGIKNIPRGQRKTTRLNPALLTGREMDVLELLKQGLQNKEIAGKLFISAKTVDHHISAILFKLDVNSRAKAVNEALRLEILK